MRTQTRNRGDSLCLNNRVGSERQYGTFYIEVITAPADFKGFSDRILNDPALRESQFLGLMK
jgi:hypothetical protein